MGKLCIAPVMVSAALLSIGLPSAAQLPATSVSEPAPVETGVYFLSRAKNLARQAAITANGGLQLYRPEPRMYGPAINSPYVRNPDGTITFSFTGGAPDQSVPTLETVATVLPDGSVQLTYNGPVRSAVGAGSLPATKPEPVPFATPIPPAAEPSNGDLPALRSETITAITPQTLPQGAAGSSRPADLAWVDQDAFRTKAQNWARQAAIKENGGLSRYRPEGSMYGPSADAPYVQNPDGSITFTFKGGAPGSTVMTVETVVQIQPSGIVSVKSNEMIRQ